MLENKKKKSKKVFLVSIFVVVAALEYIMVKKIKNMSHEVVKAKQKKAKELLSSRTSKKSQQVDQYDQPVHIDQKINKNKKAKMNRKELRRKFRSLVSKVSKKENIKKLIHFYEDELNSVHQYRKRYQMVDALVQTQNEISAKAIYNIASDFGEKDINLMNKIISKIDKNSPLHSKTVELAHDIYRKNQKFVLDDSIKNVGADKDMRIQAQIQDSWFHSSNIDKLGQLLTRN